MAETLARIVRMKSVNQVRLVSRGYRHSASGVVLVWFPTASRRGHECSGDRDGGECGKLESWDWEVPESSLGHFESRRLGTHRKVPEVTPQRDLQRV